MYPQELYSLAKFLSSVKVGQCLTDLFVNTCLSYRTLTRAADFLEQQGIIKTQKVCDSSGKKRIVV